MFAPVVVEVCVIWRPLAATALQQQHVQAQVKATRGRWSVKTVNHAKALHAKALHAKALHGTPGEGEGGAQ